MVPLLDRIWRSSPADLVGYLKRRFGRNGRQIDVPTSQGTRVAGNGIFLPAQAARMGDEETVFTTSDGHQLPVFRNYRYGIKAGWRSVPSLQALSLLEGKGLLEETGQAFLTMARGHRTLALPVAEIESGALPFIERHAHRFIDGKLGATTAPVLIPKENDLHDIVSRTAQAQKILLHRQSEIVDLGPVRLLEIGFFNGYSAFAYERLGFDVTAIDNDYGGESPATKPALRLAEQLGSQVSFQTADICRQTPFADGHFPLIISASVLEHVLDLAAALRELWRLLPGGGVMVHGYHPYFCADGAHALGIPDCPWGHLRMTDEDYLRYVDEFRPYEAASTKSWLKESLHRAYPIQEMQRLVISQGFTLARWEEMPSPSHHLSGLDRSIVARCLGIRPGLTLRDLVTRTVQFVAVKPC